jgi:hypothetical protein
MSYSIGQLRSNQIDSDKYKATLTYKQGLYKNTDSIIDFYEPCLTLNENIIVSTNSYYLKFEVAQMTDSVQEFTLKLKNDDTEDNSQSIKTFTVKKGTESTVFEIIFNPNQTYNKVIFELRRLVLDFQTTNKNGTGGRLMEVRILQFDQITNILGKIPGYTDVKSLKKIGVQGPPGLLMCINGEEIRIGRSGVYELYNDNITITYIGFVIKDSLFTQDGKDFFIMDFKY